jgi:hypothetical protein
MIPGGAGKFKAGEGTPFQAAATALTGDCTATFEFPISLKNNDIYFPVLSICSVHGLTSRCEVRLSTQT